MISYAAECDWHDPYGLYTKQGATGAATDSFSLSNTHTPNMVNAECAVIWDDAGDADQYRPDSVVLRLMADGMEVDRHELNTTDKTKPTFELRFSEQKRYHFGTPIRYTLNQNRIDHYGARITGNADEGFSVTNKHTKDKTSVSVAAHWLDANNQDGKRPKSLTIHLYADGADTGKVVVLSDNDNWIGCFDQLDIHRDGGGEIEYTVEADPFEHLSDYTFTPHGDSHAGYDLVYEHEPEVVSLEGQAVWDDAHNQDGVRPSIVRLAVRQGGATVRTFSVNPGTEQDEWAWKAENLPAYMPGGQGEALTYSIAPADALAQPRRWCR